MASSWSRHLQDYLGGYFGASSASLFRSTTVQIATHFKNAVDLSHFSRCTGSFLGALPAEPHVVLLEGAANLGNNAHAEVIAALRRAAPNALPVIVAWPRMSMVARMVEHTQQRQHGLDLHERGTQDEASAAAAAAASVLADPQPPQPPRLQSPIRVNSSYPDGVDPDLDKLRAAARDGPADLLSIGHTLASLVLRHEPHTPVRSRGCSSHDRGGTIPPCSATLSVVFAVGGTDKIHPSREGHALFGGLAAHFLASRLLAAACPTGSTPRGTAPGPPAGNGAVAHDDAYGKPLANRVANAAANAAAVTADEICYPRVELIPQPQPAPPEGWVLQDDSTSQVIASWWRLTAPGEF